MMKTRIAALGDSLTKGVILTEQNKYTTINDSFLNIISNKLDLSVLNYGRFGCTVEYGSKVVERHSSDIISSDYTFLEYGGNDCDFDWLKIAESPCNDHKARTVLEEFKNQFKSLIEKIRAIGSVPVILSLPPIISETYFSFFSRQMTQEQKDNIVKWLGGDVGIISRWHEAYNRALFMVAVQTNTQIIDITTPFDSYRGDLNGLYCRDGIHPNIQGHKLIAETIVNMYL